MKKLLLIIALLVLVLIIFAVSKTAPKVKVQVDDHELYRATLSGRIICLDNSSSDDCVQGLETDQGDRYGVNTMLMSQAHRPLVVNDVIEASGVVTPVERLSADFWREYSIIGIFSITDSLNILE